MATDRICEECGTALPAQAPGTWCPRCLLELGVRARGSQELPSNREPTSPHAVEPATEIELLLERPGTVIGRYRLIREIGRGGFGSVFLAEQIEPVRRDVALKVIKAGMDTREIVARFEAERQALALMDHPNIARVLDGGATPTGRPYFVMELVRGTPLTDYCDSARLSVRQRLELFITVCHAVQHAHQKGIIHRDLKPSNVLVAAPDGEPVPKVIDFGVAKALDQKLTEKSFATRFEQMIGTPAYMSPEQAALSGVDVDTRSDIYSLGVLLYELLTGVTPLDTEKLRTAKLDDILRVIQEVDPPRPSTRLQSRGPRMMEVARRRHAEPAALPRLIRGDLDWITMKALEKDRRRRYETVNGLAMDIGRHLNHEPVIARPPSGTYRLQKLIQRNRVVFSAASAVTVVLVISATASTWEAIRARRAEHEQQRLRFEALAEKKTALNEEEKSRETTRLLRQMLQSVGPSVAMGRDTSLMRDLLESTSGRIEAGLVAQPEVEAEMRDIIGEVYRALGEYRAAENMHRRSLEIRERVLGPENAEIADSKYHLALTLWAQGQLTEAAARHVQALDLRMRLFGSRNAEVANSQSDLARVLRQQGCLAEAEDLQVQALETRRKLFSDGSLEVADSLSGLAGTLWSERRLDESESMHYLELAIREKILGKHPEVAHSLSNLAASLRDQGKLQEAENALSRALQMRRDLLDPHHPDLAVSLNDLAYVLLRRGKALEAEPLAREALAIRELNLPDNWRTFSTRSLLGGILLAEQRTADATPLVRSAYAGLLERKKQIPKYDQWVLDEAAQRAAQADRDPTRPQAEIPNRL